MGAGFTRRARAQPPKKKKKSKEELEAEAKAKEEEDARIRAGKAARAAVLARCGAREGLRLLLLLLLRPRRRWRDSGGVRACACPTEEEKLVAEEARRVAEEARLAREAAEKRRQGELSLLSREKEDDAGDDAESSARLAKQLKERAERAAWARFVECDNRPDASREAEVNTYLAEALEAPAPDVPSALAAAQATEDVVADMDVVIANALESDDAARAAECRRVVGALRGISFAKVDGATPPLLATFLSQVRAARAHGG